MSNNGSSPHYDILWPDDIMYGDGHHAYGSRASSYASRPSKQHENIHGLSQYDFIVDQMESGEIQCESDCNDEDKNDDEEDDDDDRCSSHADSGFVYTESCDEASREYRVGGYHPVTIGEVYADRYRIETKLGWGHFSTVWLATDLKSTPPIFVAIKIQKSAEQYSDAASDEIDLLKVIRYCRDSPEWKKQKSKIAEELPLGLNPSSNCVIEFLDHFEHTGVNGTHKCMIFEVLGFNILYLIKMYDFRGIPMHLVRKIAAHSLVGLNYLHQYCQIIHTDIKPENILVALKEMPEPYTEDVRPLQDDARCMKLNEASLDIPLSVTEAVHLLPTESTNSDQQRIEYPSTTPTPTRLDLQCTRMISSAYKFAEDSKDISESATSHPDEGSNGFFTTRSQFNMSTHIRNWSSPKSSDHSTEKPLIINASSITQAESDQSLETLHSPTSGIVDYTTQQYTDRELKSTIENLVHQITSLSLSLSSENLRKNAKKNLKKKLKKKNARLQQLRQQLLANAKAPTSNTQHIQSTNEQTSEVEGTHRILFHHHKSDQQKLSPPSNERYRLKPSGSDPSLQSSFRIKNHAQELYELSRSPYHYALFGQQFPDQFINQNDTYTCLLPKSLYKSKLVELPQIPSQNDPCRCYPPLTDSHISPNAAQCRYMQHLPFDQTNRRDPFKRLPENLCVHPCSDEMQIHRSFPKSINSPHLSSDSCTCVASSTKAEKPQSIHIKTKNGLIDFKALGSSSFGHDSVDFKIADLGNGCSTYHHVSTYIQTRQYRSPEVLIGAGYDCTADVWSLACTVFELVTGEYLFEPRDSEYFSRDEDHLSLIIELLGPFPYHMIMNSTHGHEFFNRHGQLRKITTKSFSLKDLLHERYDFTDEEAAQIADFLLPMLAIDPAQRASAAEMLKHPWLKQKENKR